LYYPAELVLRNYIPDSIEPGMFFISQLSSGENFNPPQIWEFEKFKDIPNMWIPIQEVFNMYGYPVELYIIDPIDHSILATPNQIGWYDPGEESDEYRDIELKDINLILGEHEGMIEIEIDEMTSIYGATNVTIDEGKIIMRAL